jgi:hypothetical protein
VPPIHISKYGLRNVSIHLAAKGKIEVTRPTIYNWIKMDIIKLQKIERKVLLDLTDI